MARLIIQSGTPQEREFELKPGANRLGRGEDNDIQIENDSVSTHHAQVVVGDGSIVILDLNSTNGTYVNDAQVSEGVLTSGQPFRLGLVSMMIEADAPVTAVVPPAPEELAEPPPGKTTCKFHPKMAGQWLCRNCNELFCSVCVSAKPSNQGMLHLCRKCGAPCVPVKTKFVAAKEKRVVAYSDKVLFIRCIGFGFGAAMLGALIWTGLSYLMGVDVPFLFAPMVAVLCGLAVKFGSQDTPGPAFSAIAAVFCVIGSVAGKLGMIAATHLTANTNTTYFTSALGFIIAIYVAWKIGG
jgi:hypothetical protein